MFGNKKRLYPQQQTHLNMLIKANPTAKAAALRSGNTVSGKSLLDISDHFVTENVARNAVRSARSPSLPSGDDFITRFCVFQQNHPNFIIAEHMLNGIAVITCQTQWMAERLIMASKNPKGLNGSVSDAAHGWFRVPTSLLITTSIFSKSMQRWVPGVYSYSNVTKGKMGQVVVDKDFANTVDFSEAQRLGFIEAFVRFWKEDKGDRRNNEELRTAAAALLRGCAQHFRNQVTRVKRIVAIIPLDQQAKFKALSHDLLNVKTVQDFQTKAHKISTQFPHAKRWVEWWARPEIAHMLVIDLGSKSSSSDTRVNLPDTTNPQEAAHFSMYSKQGKRHELLTGLEKCHAIAVEHERTWDKVKRGVKLYYGKPPLVQRQALQGKIHHTKKRRMPDNIRKQARQHQENTRSYRPPDTIEVLLSSSRRKAKFRSQRPLTPAKPQPTPRHSESDSDVSEWHGIDNTEMIEPANSIPSPPSIHPSSPRHDTSLCKAVTFTHNDAQNSSTSRQTSVHHPDATIITSHYTMQPETGSNSLRLLISSKLRMMPSYVWKENSCWIDTCLELLFWCVMQNWSALSTFLSNDDFTTNNSPFTPIYAVLDERRRLLLSGTTKELLSMSLSEQKRSLVKYIISKGWTVHTAMNAFESDTSWLSQCISLSLTLEMGISLHQYFAVQSLRMKQCTGPNLSDLDSGKNCFTHLTVERVTWKDPLHTISAAQYDSCNGDFQRYIHHWISGFTEDAALQPLKWCWHTHEGVSHCEGFVYHTKIIVSLPQVLVVRIELDNLKDEWDFPHVLYPVQTHDAKDAGLVYDIVGHSFLGHHHFVGRFVANTDTPTRKKAVFFYDGQSRNGKEGNKGYSHRESGGIKSLLSGRNVPMPEEYKGFRTVTVFYALRGGACAQEWFSDFQKVNLLENLGINLTDDYRNLVSSQPVFEKEGFSRLPTEEMHWLSDSAKKKLNHLEYRSLDLNTCEHASKDVDEDSISKFLVESVEDVGNKGWSRSVSISTSLSAHSNLPRSTSPPATPMPFLCRCGETEDGNRQEILQKTIQCDSCECFSHVACQPTGDNVCTQKQFVCHDCQGPDLMKKATRRSTRILKAPEPLCDVPKRLQRGITVLVKDGSLFSYPARLIEPSPGNKTWKVKWWHLNHPAEDASHIPGSFATVDVTRIVDSLYQDVKGRRSVWLGRWKTTVELACDDYDESEKQEDPRLSLPYTKEMERIFSPYWKHFSTIYLVAEMPQLDGLNATEYPFAEWRRQQHTRVVPFNDAPPLWVVNGTLQHAFTLWIEHRDRIEFKSDSACPVEKQEHEQFVRQQAFRRLMEYTGCSEDGSPLPQTFDVDRDSLAQLEQKMFDMSKEAGAAGNWQWGLDVGCHQDDWHPNAHFLGEGQDNYYGNEEELLKGPQYALDKYTKKCEEHKAEVERLKKSAPKPPRPKPRPIPPKMMLKANK
ncbi:hypothetical protein Moror_11896 [Moniliophthora roreri MCA 2997]|uniref:Uncharacterized protein n=1 Tax=Moniliophthora roreri (strain MCA 2997) TaxID=1381753 RepID=V2X3W6_MONRO|nr:hypothetical protein Moror_11896 [Moniliophthora roreri MCA 2997]